MTRNIFAIGSLAGAARHAVAGLALVLACTVAAQQPFATPEAAADAFVDGLARSDRDRIRTVLGAGYRTYLPSDAVKGDDVTSFLAAWAKSHRVVRAGDDRAWLEVGTRGWTLPIPIVKSAAGWRFDTQGAAEELRTRRIGRNELDVIQVMLALTDAQQDYRDQDAARQYAQRILSSPGKRDGLYWPTLAGEPPSPLGPIASEARRGEAYHGYHYRILRAQGRDAAGGAVSYVKDGRMTGGYAFVAWPAKWGDTGVMTFVVAADGVVWQKNLGPDTDRLARAMTTYNPDASWTRAQPAR